MAPLSRLPSPGERLFDELWGRQQPSQIAPAIAHLSSRLPASFKPTLQGFKLWGCWVVRRQRDRNRLWWACLGTRGVRVQRRRQASWYAKFSGMLRWERSSGAHIPK
eukprot:CAMPEP_0183336644 /NCGR_PEP_ID=MMETSP0164_2-20130417/4568_1 /TAXON_ID=221442 /ORGANISM="Coccolithus pelagicus ssp braarudi, Strain PLY182g" /LENGTH=106 /DNA_ID=CAMNT_0025506213 /DNA_START=144 /DNA_END=464 /DNA_ORIENTATION=-